MQGHYWFALRVGNIAWHTVNSSRRETQQSEGKRYRLNKLSSSRLEVSYLWHSESVKLCLHCVLYKYFDQTANFRIWGRSSKAHPCHYTAKGHVTLRRRNTFNSFCYLNSLMFRVMEKVYFAYSNTNLMKLTQPELRECVQCSLCVYASGGDEVKNASG